ncbi:MAG: HAMP domain-containing histidine kinase [Clostridiales bacterium]|nr:HAMP domain-containing histidine kinase [Clostridiales bacterium]MBS5878011.1 HAMP domain-containing histidine kinase [Clostridiales bacterium]
MNRSDEKGILILGIIFSLAAGTGVFFLNRPASIVTVILGAVLTLMYYFELKTYYRKIEGLNDYLERIVRGDFDLKIGSNEEGKLSILQNNIYKVLVMLKTSNEIIKKDRSRLADSMNDISHQLKTPLTSILIMTDLLMHEGDKEKRQEMVEVIDRQLEKMKWLITNLLKLSKLDADAVPFKKEKVSSAEFIEGCLLPLLPMAELADVKVIKDISDLTFACDKNWTTEAVTNVIKNCLEHTSGIDGRPGKIKISVFPTNISTDIIIEDNGSGISKKDINHIFERFYHGENSGKDSVGIGLALAKAIMEKQKGSISVESVEGQGSRFTIKLYKTII